MRRALVTGGGGFVGLAVVRRLREAGVATTVVGRNRYPAAGALGAECRVGDIRDREFLGKVVAGHDTLFHVAALAGIWGRRQDFFSINVEGTKNVLAACRANRVRHLVYTSTPSVVFDGRSIEGGDESLPYSARPLCDYAASKIEAEKLVLAANSSSLRTCALRPHLVWGPGDTQIIPRLLRQGRSGRLRIVGNGVNRVDISYIDNVADAHLLAGLNLEHSGTAAGLPFFISQGEPVVLWQWINELFDRVNIPRPDKKVSARTAFRIGWLLETVYRLTGRREEPRMTRFLAEQLALSHWFSPRRAGDILGYTPQVSTQQGMERLVAWLGGQAGLTGS